MEFTFASKRQLSFIISTGGRNLLVAFGERNQAGVSGFMTMDEKVAQAIRRHSLSRRGIIEETTKPVAVSEEKPVVTATETVSKPSTKRKPLVSDEKPATAVTAEAKEREYGNYTVARESICKELGLKKSEVRNPSALDKIAKEHGIIIKYKEL
jgi:hypothetical protein